MLLQPISASSITIQIANRGANLCVASCSQLVTEHACQALLNSKEGHAEDTCWSVCFEIYPTFCEVLHVKAAILTFISLTRQAMATTAMSESMSTSLFAPAVPSLQAHHLLQIHKSRQYHISNRKIGGQCDPMGCAKSQA